MSKSRSTSGGFRDVTLLFSRVIHFFLDFNRELTTGSFWDTDHCLLKPFFDFRNNQGPQAGQSYYISGLHRSNFMWLVGLGFSENQKMVLVNSDQYLESYLWSILYWNLKKVIYPIIYLSNWTWFFIDISPLIWALQSSFFSSPMWLELMTIFVQSW